MKNSIYLKDIIRLMPPSSSLEIWTTDEHFSKKLKTVLFHLDENRIFTIVLDEENRKLLIAAVDDSDMHDHIERLVVRFNNELLFEAYDGMEFGAVSKKIALPPAFIENYIKGDMCIVSAEW